MTRLAEPTTRGGRPRSAGPGDAVGRCVAGRPAVAATLREIAALLERVAAGGESGHIDLCRPGQDAHEQARLKETLGPGEVLIVLQADGESTIRETSVQGVWWNEHRDRNGMLVASFLEIAAVPAILMVDPEQLRRGAELLRADLQTVLKSVD